jgi:ankyrin repeat protein
MSKHLVGGGGNKPNNAKVYVDVSPVGSEAEYIHHPVEGVNSNPDWDRLPAGVQGLLSTLKIPYGNQFGRDSDVDPTLGLLNHIVECVAALRDTVKVYKQKETGEFSHIVGSKIASALTGEIGKMLIYSLTNDWDGQEQAAGHFHTISAKILNNFPEIATRQHKVSGKMLLHHTCHKSSSRYTTEYVNSLINIVPSSVSCQDAHGAVPLHWAMRNKHVTIDMIRSLVQANPNGPRVRDRKGFLPLHWAVHQDHPRSDVVEALIRIYPAAIREPCASGGLPLHWSVNQDNVCLPVVKILIKVYPEALNVPCTAGWLPIHRLLDRIDPDVTTLKYLIDQFPRSLQRPCNDGQLPLHKVVDHMPVSIEAFKVILEAFPGACQVADREGYLPLHMALDCAEPNTSVIARLLNEFPNAARRATLDELLPLHLAVTTSQVPDVEIVRLLVSAYPLAAQQVAVDTVPENEMANPDTWKGAWIEKKWTPLSRAIDRRLHDVTSVLKAALTSKHGGTASMSNNLMNPKHSSSNNSVGSRSSRNAHRRHHHHHHHHDNSSRDSRSSMESPKYEYDSESGASNNDYHSENGPPIIGAKSRNRHEVELSDESELESRGSSRQTGRTNGSKSKHGGRGFAVTTGKFRINIPKDVAKVRTSPLYGDRPSMTSDDVLDMPQPFQLDDYERDTTTGEKETPTGYDSVSTGVSSITKASPAGRVISSAGTTRSPRSPRTPSSAMPSGDNPYLASQAAVTGSGGNGGSGSKTGLSVVTQFRTSEESDNNLRSVRESLTYDDSGAEDNASQSTHVRVMATKGSVHGKFVLKSHTQPALTQQQQQQAHPQEGRSRNNSKDDDDEYNSKLFEAGGGVRRPAPISIRSGKGFEPTANFVEELV